LDQLAELDGQLAAAPALQAATARSRTLAYVQSNQAAIIVFACCHLGSTAGLEGSNARRVASGARILFSCWS